MSEENGNKPLTQPSEDSTISASIRAEWADFGKRLVTPPVGPAVVIVGVALTAYGVLAERFEIPTLAAAETQSVAQIDAYCAQVSDKAATLGNLHSVAALVLSLVAILGGLLQATQDGGDSITARMRRPLLFASAPCAVLAIFLFFRASAANELASVTNNARSGDVDSSTMLKVCTKAWGAWVLSRNDANGVAKAAIEESVQGKTTALDAKVLSVTDKTIASLDSSKEVTDSQNKAIDMIADAVVNRDPAAAASAKALVLNSAPAASAAAKSAQEARLEANKPIVHSRLPKTPHPDGGAP